MSAAKKLKALMEDERWHSHDSTVLAGLALTFYDTAGGGVLPQIVAVVEAAEKAEDILRQHARGGDLIHGRHVLHDALAALDEKLP